MTQVLAQNLNFKKTSAFLLILVLITDLVFVSVLLPLKEVKAVVPVVNVDLTPIQTGWKALDTVIQKVISSSSVISSLVDLWTKADTLLSRAVRAAAYALLIQILNMITNDIIRWIQGGGKPRFVSDWKGFLTDAASKAGGAFVEKYLGMGWLCQPFDIQIKIALLTVPKFEERVKCSLEDMGRNIGNFFNNFSNGGWTTWIQLTEPQNNFYGAYLMAVDKKMEEEAKAEEAAKSEAESGGGFLGHKMCTQCKIGGVTKSGLTDCGKVSCDSEDCIKCEIQTPPTVIQYEAQKAVDSARSLMEKQIAALTPNLGMFTIYVTAIINALINRVIKEGLSVVGIIGPSSEHPDVPVPPGVPIITTGLDLAQAILSYTPLLIEQQKLLKENLENELLSQQQKNLAVLNAIGGTNGAQIQTLQTIRDLLVENCNLPSWITGQTISTQTTGETTVQIIQYTATNIGSITIKKTTTTNELGSTITYEIQQMTTLASSQITILEQEINSTQVWINDVNSAISANQGAIKAAGDYKTLYENTLQPPTPEEKAILTAEENKMKTAYNLAIAASQKAAKSPATDLSSLIQETTSTNFNVVQQALNVGSARGSPEIPEAGTLYYQLQTVQSKLSEVQSTLTSCRTTYYNP